MIDKWLKAGVLEDGLLRHATEGSPQGGVVSPCLSNIFLHYVLDEWFENEVKPRLKGKCTLVRFADDAVMAFADFRDAQRVLDVLGKRLARYGLTLHPDKTRFVDFRSYRPDGKEHPEADGTTFTFLGFCHVMIPSFSRCAIHALRSAKLFLLCAASWLITFPDRLWSRI
jgi:RNA-directed DNA polymerase